jgi:hypothetical protein
MDFEQVESAQLQGRQWAVDGPVMVLPYTDADMAQRAGQHAAQRAGAKGLLLAVHDTERQGFVATVNLAFAATRSPWLGYMAQDAFAGRDWMALALQALHRQRGVFLGFNDGKWQGALAAFGLASRAWAGGNYAAQAGAGATQGPFFHPSYQRHYADAELTVLARQAKGYVYEPNSVLMEVDWAKEAQAVDPVDRALYRQRAALGFDGRVAEQALLGLFA